MNTNNPFTWTEEYKGPVFVIKLKGDFRSGIYFENEKKIITSSSKKQAESNLVLFDLSEMIYWDTETMNFLNDLLKELNLKHHRAGILSKKDTYIGDRFYEKFGDNRGKEIWFETKEHFLNSIKLPQK